MTCNCGNGDTPEYYITLDGVGVDGYSPEVNVVDEDTASFKLEAINKSNTQKTPAIPKLSYLPTEYLKVDGSNASNPITLNNLQIRNNSGYVTIGQADLPVLNLQSRNVNLVGTDSEGNQQSIIQLQNDGDVLVYAGERLLLRGSGARPTYQQGTGTTYTLARLTDIPTVGNGTITFTQGGVTKGTITTNQSGNTTINLDAGGGELTNPLVISNQAEDRTLSLGIDEDNDKVLFNYSIGGVINVPIPLLYGASQPLVLTERNADGLYTLSLNIDSNTLKVDSNDKLTIKDVQSFTKITLANGYNTGEGLYGWLDDGSSTIPLVRVSDLDDVIIGDDGSKLVLHGNETRPSYFDSHTTSYLALYTDIPDTSDMATKTWVGNQGYLTSSSLSGYATETWVGQQGYALASNLSTVATSGSYADLLNRPTIPTNADYVDLTSNQTVGGNKTFTGTNYLRNTYICNAGGTYFGRMRATDNKFTFEGIGTNRSINFIPDGTGELQYNGNEVQTTNKLVTSVDSSSTDSQYPSAKLFYDTVGDIETLINAL